jgi:hypothetical protein
MPPQTYGGQGLNFTRNAHDAVVMGPLSLLQFHSKLRLEPFVNSIRSLTRRLDESSQDVYVTNQDLLTKTTYLRVKDYAKAFKDDESINLQPPIAPRHSQIT